MVTSPPYFWLRDYAVEGQLGMEDSVQEYISSITSVMTEVRRVLSQDGVAFFNVVTPTIPAVASPMARTAKIKNDGLDFVLLIKAAAWVLAFKKNR